LKLTYNNYMKEDKLLQSYKKRVYKKYPNAFLKKTSSGYTICQENDDFSYTDILNEMLMPAAPSAELAWQTASQLLKIDQNINRTHPLRLEGMKMEDKLQRIEMRKMKGEIAKEKYVKRK
jgi:hypothetical protein